MCAKQSAYDRYEDLRRFKQSVPFKRARTEAFRHHMELAIKSLHEAAVNLRAAKENAERGAWSKNIRAHGLQPKAIAAIRRWLEQREQLERKSAASNAAAKEPGESWME